MSEGVIVEDVIDDLKRIQNFGPETLVQGEKLGQEFEFSEAVEPATRLVALFAKLPADSLREFPSRQLNEIQAVSKGAYHLFDQILNFSARGGDPENRHQQLIDQLKSAYQEYFTKLFPLIAFSVARQTDFNQLSSEGRAAVQSVRDESKALMEELHGVSDTAEGILQEVRDAAAEQGVTQQAKYFSDEAGRHQESSTKWLITALACAGLLVSYSVSTLFFPVFGWFQADTAYGAVQVAVSKVLVFVVLSFLLLQAVKNYSAHRHNLVVNRHRQNALMTYTTLTEAGSSPEVRDTVLQHAAAAIYAPVDSGYVKSEERGYGSAPLLGISPRNVLGGMSPLDGA